MPIPARICEAINELNRWVALPGRPPFCADLMYEFTNQPDWSNPYLVEPALPGCYIFQGADEMILYVGSVSCNNELGRRFANRYISRESRPDGDWKRQRNELVGACAIYAVTVPREYAFITPAIEQFLITALDPVRNVKCRIAALRERIPLHNF